MIGRVELGVRLEGQVYQFVAVRARLRSGVGVEEGVGQAGQHELGPLVFFLARLLFLAARFGIVGELLQLLIVFGALLGGQRLAIDRDGAAQTSLRSLDHFLGDGMVLLLGVVPVHEVAMNIVGLDFVPGRLADQFLGFEIGFLLGDGGRARQKQHGGASYRATN